MCCLCIETSKLYVFCFKSKHKPGRWMRAVPTSFLELCTFLRQSILSAAFTNNLISCCFLFSLSTPLKVLHGNFLCNPHISGADVLLWSLICIRLLYTLILSYIPLPFLSPFPIPPWPFPHPISLFVNFIFLIVHLSLSLSFPPSLRITFSVSPFYPLSTPRSLNRASFPYCSLVYFSIWVSSKHPQRKQNQ